MARSNDVNEKMREESKKKIIEASISLFILNGYYSVKIKEIAKKADISVGRIYWYFENKEEILKEIMSDGFNLQMEMLNNIKNIDGSREEKLKVLIKKYLELSRNNTEFIQIMMSVMAGGSTKLLLELGFDTKDIGMRYHMILHDILCSNDTMDEGTAHGLSIMFFSVFFGMITIYGKDWHQIPDEFFTKKLEQLLL